MPTWDEIVASYGPVVVRLAQRILGSGLDAEDIAQEVFLEAYQLQKKRTVDHWPGLLRKMTTCRALDRLRRRRRLDSLDGLEIEHRGDDPHQSAVTSELAARLREAMGQLPERQAAVFSLRYFDELSYEEIAEALDIDSAAVGMALHKARIKLQKLLNVELRGVQS